MSHVSDSSLLLVEAVNELHMVAWLNITEGVSSCFGRRGPASQISLVSHDARFQQLNYYALISSTSLCQALVYAFAQLSQTFRSQCMRRFSATLSNCKPILQSLANI